MAMQTVFEALNPHGMIRTSTLSIYKVIDKLHMPWMGIWIRHHHQANTTTLTYHNLGSQLHMEFLVAAVGAKSYLRVVFLALNPHGMVPIFTLD
jgi:hypothetical protein